MNQDLQNNKIKAVPFLHRALREAKQSTAMACTSGDCGGGSGCYKEEDDDGCKGVPTGKQSTTNGNHRLCLKCKVEEATTSGMVEGSNNLCRSCFRNSVFGKFKQAVTTQDLISPTDNVLVAFSGGPASRVVLEFVHELQHKAQRNSDASKDKSYPVFGVGVAFIDETIAASIPSQELEEAIQDMRSIVSTLAPPAKELHVVAIESIFSSHLEDGRSKMEELLNATTDITGREDLLQHLRMLSLQKIALEKKYNKLVLGSCTSRIACNVISATVKGQGYSLPADVQYIDARWEIPIVLPLRDCLAQELTILCQLNSLKTLDQLGGSCSGINGLVSTFITLLQEENPAREHTIVRTAQKLIPFHFNRLPETTHSSGILPRWRRRKQNLKPDQSMPSEFFCAICNSPHNKSNLDHMKSKVENCDTDFKLFEVSCCPSCQFQILPKDSSSMEHFYSFLPQEMIARAKDGIVGNQAWLRARIEDCLLSDGENEI